MGKPSSSYELNFGEGTFDAILNLVPKSYLDCIRDALLELAGDPTNNARRCAHPYPGAKQFEFECAVGEHGFVFRAYFFFEPGETHIRVFDLRAAANW